MRRVVSLLTSIDLTGDDPGFSLGARLDAVLADGRRVALLTDRGWGGTTKHPAGMWAITSADELRAAALVVVGPDEGEPDEAYWASLAHILADAGVEIAPDALAALPHEVALSDAVVGRLAG